MESLSVRPGCVLVDGNRSRGLEEYTVSTLVGGDGKSASIAAASILAKVSRDRLMRELALSYPGYGLEIHKGYPTKAHVEALRRLGPAQIHRTTFLKKILSMPDREGGA